MKKTLVAFGILMALAFNTQTTFAVCHCHSHHGKHIMKKSHHVRHMRKAYHRYNHPLRSCPCGAACPIAAPCRPVSQPCACPAAPCYETPCCPAAPCYNPCCD